MYRTASILALSIVLAGCTQSAPTGQVVATVDGSEITRPELNAALPKVKPGSVRDAAVMRNAVLDQLVMQSVIVGEAKRLGLDKSQDYLLASRQADSQILSNLLSKRVLQSLRAPQPGDIDTFIADNPTRFANRVVLNVDQIRFPQGTLSDEALKATHSIYAVIAQLARAGVDGQRLPARVDSAVLEPKALAILLGLPAGEPFIVQEGDTTVVSTIIGRVPTPLTGDDARKVATQLMQQAAAKQALVKQLQVLRQNAKVEYQTGFAAPKAATAGAPKPAASPR